MSHDISFILVIVSNGLYTAYHSLGFDNAQRISVSISAGLSLIIPSLATQNGPLCFWQNPEVSHSQITQGHDLLAIACYYATITQEIVFDTIGSPPLPRWRSMLRPSTPARAASRPAGLRTTSTSGRPENASTTEWVMVCRVICIDNRDGQSSF